MIMMILVIMLMLLPLDMLMLLQYHTARRIIILALPRAAQLVGLARSNGGPVHSPSINRPKLPGFVLLPSFTLPSDSTSASVSKSE